jgi:hypothetical protein
MEALMSSPTAEQLFVESGTAEEICKVLEQTVLKYFPPQIEVIDPSLFADHDAAQKPPLTPNEPTAALPAAA